MESETEVILPEKIPDVGPKFITPRIEINRAEECLTEYQRWLIGRRNKLQKEMNGYMRKHGHLRELHIVMRQSLRKELRTLHDLKRKYGLST